MIWLWSLQVALAEEHRVLQREMRKSQTRKNELRQELLDARREAAATQRRREEAALRVKEMEDRQQVRLVPPSVQTHPAA